MKKLLTILGVLIVLAVALSIFVFVSLKPVGIKGDPEIFVVAPGTNKIEIADHLYKAKLVKNKYATIIYIFMHPGMNLQAGTYEISREKSTQEIVQQIADGKIISIIPTISITFVEGKTFEEYAALIANNFDATEEDIKDLVKDKEYLKKLIEDYWFLDDSILNDDLYYSLEGYLAPDTYEFYANASIDNIIRKLLDQTGKRLEKYKDDITSSGFSAHEILTLASTIEKEGNTKEDRQKISQVFHKRLEIGEALGSDVTTYYAVHKSLKQALYATDLAVDSPYNTRNKNMAGKLPVGPICNPGDSSINAAIYPAETDYLYFLADEKGNVYFAKDYNEFAQLKTKYIK